MNYRNNRIVTVDVIRGFALMGLFLVHVIEYYELYWLHPEPGWVHETVSFVFSGKAYSLFALLFGFSFYIMLEREGTTHKFSPQRFLWRMVILLLFGYLHGLIYPGDILQMLALFGVFLVAVYRLPTPVLLVMMVLFLGQFFTAIQYLITLQNPEYPQPVFWAMSGRNFEAYAQPSLLEYIRHVAWDGQFPKWVLLGETGGVEQLMGLFIAGLLIGRFGFFENNHGDKRLIVYLSLAIACAVIFHVLTGALDDYFPEFMPRWAFYSAISKYYIHSVIAAYIMLFLLLLKRPAIHSILRPFAACGRMSLTLYVAQSLMVVPLLYGYGLGWHDDIGQVNALLLALALWVLQVVFANLWFKRYRYGPLEWLWRALTWLNFKLPFKLRPVYA